MSHEFLFHSVPLTHLPAQGDDEGRDNQGTSVRPSGPSILRRRRPRHRILTMCKKENQVPSDLGVCISFISRVSMI
jgi:hypothetical protein